MLVYVARHYDSLGLDNYVYRDAGSGFYCIGD